MPGLIAVAPISLTFDVVYSPPPLPSNLSEVAIPGSQAEFEEQEQFFDEVNHRYIKSIEMSGKATKCRQFLAFMA